MKILVICCFVFISLSLSTTSYLSYDKILQELYKLPSQSKKPFVFFLGLTGSGKSALINYLMGTKMTYTKDNGLFTLSVSDKMKQHANIFNGITKQSNSTISSKILEGEKMFFVDIEDSDDQEKKKLNEYLICKILEKGFSLKVVLLFEIGSLDKSNFKQSYQQIYNKYLIPFTKFSPSISVLITKVKQEQKVWSSYSEILKQKNQEYKSMLQNRLFEIKTITRRILISAINTNGIELFPAVDKMGDQIDVIKKYIEGIQVMNQYPIKECKPIILVEDEVFEQKKEKQLSSDVFEEPKGNIKNMKISEIERKLLALQKEKAQYQIKYWQQKHKLLDELQLYNLL